MRYKLVCSCDRSQVCVQKTPLPRRHRQEARVPDGRDRWSAQTGVSSLASARKERCDLFGEVPNSLREVRARMTEIEDEAVASDLDVLP